MKQAAILGDRKAGLIEVPDPQPKEDWVVVKIHAAPMCTEYKGFGGEGTSEYLGHEAAGEVVAVAQPGKVKEGDRVVVMPQYPCGQCRLCISGEYIHCQNSYNFTEFTGSRSGSATMAQYILKPSWILPKIPDGMSYERGSLACCALGPSFGTFQTMGLSTFDTVLITGIGPVGFGALVNARFRGARVIAVESMPWRVERAKEMGADEVLNPSDEDIVQQIMNLTDGIGVDYAIDCSGNVNAQRLCIDATRRKGKVAFVGECGTALEVFGSRDFIRKGLTLFGNWHYNLNDFPGIMKVAAESPLIELFISHVLPMSDIQKALEIGSSQQNAKMILNPWE